MLKLKLRTTTVHTTRLIYFQKNSFYISFSTGVINQDHMSNTNVQADIDHYIAMV